MKNVIAILILLLSTKSYCQSSIIGKWKEDSCSMGKIPVTWEFTFSNDSTGLKVTNNTATNIQLVHKFKYRVVGNFIYYKATIKDASTPDPWKIIKLNDKNLSLNIAGDRIIYFSKE